jgi:predicted glycosyltransferase
VTRVLFISGSIGLGHAARDLAIARGLRELNPAIEIAWLAGDPARRLIEQAGERVLPESDMLDETALAEEAADGFSLNLLTYVARAGPAWKRSVAAFRQVTARYAYDVLVGDEAYEVAGALAKHPELRMAPFALIYDFVGLDAASRHPAEQLTAYAVNRSWGGGFRRRPPKQDLVLFVGEPEDIPDRRFGPLLANRREYARRHYRFLGYIFGFDPADYADRPRLRAALGYDDRPLIVCTVGGTAVGADLLRLCAAAYPHIEARLPDARMVLVCGPRIDPTTVAAPPGVEVRGYVQRLYEHLAACDVAVVQGGGTTTLELTALRRPFLYFPLENHFEQNRVVAARLARHRAGERRLYSRTTPLALAEAIVAQLGRAPTWPPVATDGALRAAELIQRLAATAETSGGPGARPTANGERPRRTRQSSRADAADGRAGDYAASNASDREGI